ncbi:hypothetical protein N7520_010617 [Penicillium odoratum]|uniref:uncharacterized protein n=1 Tax=Penicillium odoratum TaxID=1167516 RepID=UPI0025468C16|nr:uncharacterized protein N7520_010617 [Penicillium odoratum]KAJ5745435.1 hypothetical protein N7520_010617 [Penicillium odoratum]
MAPISKTLALAGALFAIAGVAAPIEKRAVVWETVTDVVWTTVDVTTTLYPQELVATATVVPVTTSAAAETIPTEKSKPEGHRQPETTSTSTSSTSTVAPAPATTAPAITEPATTSVVAAVVESTTSAAPVVTTTSAAAVVAAETEPTTTAEPTSTTSTSSAAASSTASTVSTSSSDYSGSCDESSPCTGQMTYYDTATSASNPSACGTTNDGLTELVLALPVGIMTDSDCGKTVTITYGGVTKSGTVVDKCMGCDDGSVDLSRAFFEEFDSLSAGRLSGATWYIN